MRSLRRAVDALTVAVGIMALALLIDVWRPGSAEQDARLDAVALGIDFRAARHTLIVVVQVGCPGCESSMPFYRRLADEVPADVQMVVAAPERDVHVGEYLSAHNVRPDAIASVRRDDLPVLMTPALLLVDSAGRVVRGWRGVLSPRLEDEVLVAVQGKVGPRRNGGATGADAGDRGSKWPD